MSLKPLVATPDELGKYSAKEFKSSFFKAIKKLAKKHDKPEAAAPFFLQIDAKLTDSPSSFFMVFGKLNKWKAYAKENAVKSEGLRGACYVSYDEKAKCLVLNLMPVAGKLKAKENLIAKEMKKVVSASRCSVTILKGDFSEEQLDKLAAATEAMEDVADDVAADAMEDALDDLRESAGMGDNDEPGSEGADTNLTPAQQKKIAELRGDIEALENLLEKMAASDDPKEIQTLDKDIRTVFAKYVGGK